MSWTDERIERLPEEHVGQRATASQIADELGGVSHNASDRQGHRLGLEQRPSPVKPERGEKAKKPAAAALPPLRLSRREGRSSETCRRGARYSRACRSAGRDPESLSSGDAISFHRPRRLRSPGPGDQQPPIPPAPPRLPRTRQAEPRGCGQDRPARSQRPRLQEVADRSPGRARLPLLWRTGEPRLPLLRDPLRRRLSGAAPAPRPPSAPAASIWRTSRPLRAGEDARNSRVNTRLAGSFPSRMWFALSSSIMRARDRFRDFPAAGQRRVRILLRMKDERFREPWPSSSRTSMSAAISIISCSRGTGPSSLKWLVPFDQFRVGVGEIEASGTSRPTGFCGMTIRAGSSPSASCARPSLRRSRRTRHPTRSC